MYKSKFNTLLRSLSPFEVQSFGQYLRRQTSDRTTLRIFDYVAKVHSEPDAIKKLDLLFLYRVLFHIREPLSTAKRKNLLNICSDLHIHLQDFLIIERLRKKPLEKKAIWLEVLEERGLTAELVKQTDQYYFTLIKEPQKSMKDLLKIIAAEEAKYHCHTIIPDFVDNLDFIQKQRDSLEAYTLLFNLKIACEILAERKLMPNYVAKELPGLPEQFPQSPIAAGVPLCKLYWHLYQLIRPEPQVEYAQMISLIEENAPNIDLLELHELIKYIYNYNAPLSRRGEELEVALKLHELNKLANQYAYFKRVGNMTPTQFNNIVNVACAVKDFEWVLIFVDIHGHSMSESARMVAQATIWFEQGEFESVIYHLNRMSFRGTSDQVRSKLLVLRSYYCLGMAPSVIINFCDNFEGWLQRHQSQHLNLINAGMNFIKLFRMLLHRNTSSQDLLVQIETHTELVCRKWLHTQVQLNIE